ncbi:MAG: hypothetical protein K2W85_14890 [Phycisphaerales bacterium]|nr:hypothetical protein [Phycisphaerales bacterium]
MSTLESKPFLDDGQVAVHGLRRALANVIASVNASPDEPQELSRRFGLDKTLTWRIARVIREEDAWEAVQHIPRRPSIQIFATALSKHGAPAPTIEALWSALDVFELFVETHSGDRETLEMMASSASRKSAYKRLEAFRKSGYQANCAIWGVSARVQFAAKFIAPSATPDMLTLATICGLVGFRRLRSNTPWAMASIQSWKGKSEEDPDYLSSVRPLIDDPPSQSELLLPEFCSQPLPSFSVIENPRGVFRHMLDEGAVGNTASATVCLGWISSRSAPVHESYPDETGDHVVIVSTPAEELFHDVFVHNDLAWAFDVSAHLYGQLPGGPQYPTSGPDAPKLPVPTDIIDLGSPPQIVTQDIPRYDEMITLGARRLGHELTSFRAFRYRLRYPPIPTMSVIRHPLLKRP